MDRTSLRGKLGRRPVDCVVNSRLHRRGMKLVACSFDPARYAVSRLRRDVRGWFASDERYYEDSIEPECGVTADPTLVTELIRTLT